MDDRDIDKPTEEYDVEPEEIDQMIGKKKKTGKNLQSQYEAEGLVKGKIGVIVKASQQEKQKIPLRQRTQEWAADVGKSFEEKKKAFAKKKEEIKATTPYKAMTGVKEIFTGEVLNVDEKGKPLPLTYKVGNKALPVGSTRTNYWGENIKKGLGVSEEQQKPTPMNERERTLSKLLGVEEKPSPAPITPQTGWGGFKKNVNLFGSNLAQKAKTSPFIKETVQRFKEGPTYAKDVPFVTPLNPLQTQSIRRRETSFYPSEQPTEQPTEQRDFGEVIRERAPFKPTERFPFSSEVPISLTSRSQPRIGGMDDLRDQSEREALAIQEGRESGVCPVCGSEFTTYCQNPQCGFGRPKLPPTGIIETREGPHKGEIRRAQPYMPVSLKQSFLIRPLIGKPKRVEIFQETRRPFGTILSVQQRPLREFKNAPNPSQEANLGGNLGFNNTPFKPMTFQFIQLKGIKFFGPGGAQPIGLGTRRTAYEETPEQPAQETKKVVKKK